MKKSLCLLLMSVFVVGCGDASAPDTIPLTADQLGDVVPKAQQTPGRSEPLPPDSDAPEEFTETESGLKYRMTRKSVRRKPTIDDAVEVHYRGTLDDGSVFDSTYSRKQSAVFGVNGVIKGWQEGLQLMGTGGMIELIVPSELGYGAAGHGTGIPPNATLHFTVELVRILPPAE